MKDRGKALPSNQHPQIEAPRRDLLADLGEVLGREPVPAADVPALLKRLAPHWAPYQGMTGKTLREQLVPLGVKVASTGNRWPIDPVTVREALAKRMAEEMDEED
jgi:S-DNA-T family DNA segregation ATPase FtsK/SpoIIIE